MEYQPERRGQMGGGNIDEKKPASAASSPQNRAPLKPGSMYSPLLRQVLSGDELKKHLAAHLSALGWEFTPNGVAMLSKRPKCPLQRKLQRESLREVLLGFAALQLGEVGLPSGAWNMGGEN